MNEMSLFLISEGNQLSQNKKLCFEKKSENFRHSRHRYFSLLLFFFLNKKIIVCILKGILPFKIHKIIYFTEIWQLRYVWVTLNTGIYYFGLSRYTWMRQLSIHFTSVTYNEHQLASSVETFGSQAEIKSMELSASITCGTGVWVNGLTMS